MQSSPNTRESNIELLRIVCMLFIVAGHICKVHPHDFDFGNADYLITRFTKSFTSCAVNAFILISGYFSIRFKAEKLLKLTAQTWFYAVLFFAVATLAGWHMLSVKKDFLVLFPVFSKQYWFITTYIVLFLLSPLLNGLCNIMSKKLLVGIDFRFCARLPVADRLLSGKFSPVHR